MNRRILPNLLAALAALALAAAPVRAAPEAGLIFVNSARSGVTLTPTGGSARPLARGELLTASGQTIDVPASLPLLLVLSNGAAAYLPAGGQLTLEEFTQEPVSDTSQERDYEPSRSSLRLNLAQGTLVLTGRTMVPTSTVAITTPLAQFNCHSQSLLVRADGDSLTITIYDGTADFTIPATGFKDTLQAGQTATLTRASLHDPYPFKLTRITTDDQTHFQDWWNISRAAELRTDFIRSDSDKKLYLRQAVPYEFTTQLAVDDPRYM
jgi:hypothetical protein